MKLPKVALVILALVLTTPAGMAQTVQQSFDLGNSLQSAGRFQEAESVWRRLIQQLRQYPNDPNLVYAYSNLGNALMKQNRSEEATSAYQNAIQLDPRAPIAYNGLGNALRQQRKLEEAANAYRKAVQLNPTNAGYLFNLCKVLREQGKLEDAVSSCHSATALAPRDASYFNSLGNALRDNKKLGEAVVAYRKAIEIDPSYAYAYDGLGQVLVEQKKIDEAILIFKKVIQLYPEFPNVYISLGNALTEQQKLGEAVAAYRKAIQLAPGYAGSYYNLGILLGQKQDFNEAKTAYLKALSLPDVIVSTKSTHSSAYNNLGIIYLRQGQIEQAVAQFKKSLAIDANNKNALRNLDEAMRQLSLKQGQGQEVVGSTTEYLERNPISETKRSIVLIQPEFQYSGFGKGTGYVIRRDGNRAWILTNRHVIVDSEGNKPAIKVRLELFYGNLPEGKLAPRLPATIEKFTSVKDAQDLAILRVDNLPGDIQPLLFSDQVPSKDSRITIIGHPGRNRWLQLDRSLLKISKSDDLLIDGSIEEGASGSPVLNSVKQVIGIVYETDSMGGRNDFVVAHRVNSIKHIMQQWGISAP